jgi:hypothetical protein
VARLQEVKRARDEEAARQKRDEKVARDTRVDAAIAKIIIASEGPLTETGRYLIPFNEFFQMFGVTTLNVGEVGIIVHKIKQQMGVVVVTAEKEHIVIALCNE